MKHEFRLVAITSILVFFASLLLVPSEAASRKPKLNSTSIRLTEGSTKKLKVKKNNVYKITKTTWKSKNKSIATVTSKGKVKAVSEGTTSVIATVKARPTKNAGIKTYKLSCKVVVTAGSSATETPEAAKTPQSDETATPETSTEGARVYFTSDISAESLVEIYNKLEWTPQGSVAVKISTGEPPASNYLRPELIADLVNQVKGTIVECNTAYGGSRSSSSMHHQVAEDHGFTAIADFDLLDEDGDMEIPVTGGKHLKSDRVGSHFVNYDNYLILSHFKGHAMAGYGGAIKNTSIGLGSSAGKSRIHTGGASDSSWFGGDQNSFLESMGEAAKSVSDYLDSGKRIVYINVMNRLSIDCDCDGNPAEPDIHDIGILASYDPVALDQACIDMIYKADGNESFVRRVEGRNGLHTLEYAEEIGYGSRKYQMVSID